MLIFPSQSIFPQLAAPPLHTSVCGVVEVERLTRRLRGEEVEEVRGEEVREVEQSLYIYLYTHSGFLFQDRAEGARKVTWPRNWAAVKGRHHNS